MNEVNKGFYDAIVAAMQVCDEIGGPDRGDYISIMQQVAVEATRRAETALDGAARDAVLDLLYDNGGAVLAWQVPAALSGVAADMYDEGLIGFDVDADLYLHPDALPDADGTPGCYSIPHQFAR